MNQLALLQSLETIRDLLAPIIQERDAAKLTNPKGLIEAHRTAHYSCEATYADLEAEAHAMSLAQGADMEDDWPAS